MEQPGPATRAADQPVTLLDATIAAFKRSKLFPAWERLMRDGEEDAAWVLLMHFALTQVRGAT